MDVAGWITLGIGVCGLALNLMAFAVGYGVLKGTLAALDNRVKALEAEANAIVELKVAVAEVKTEVRGLHDQFKTFNAATAWMRASPPEYEPAAALKPRGRK